MTWVYLAPRKAGVEVRPAAVERAIRDTGKHRHVARQLMREAQEGARECPMVPPVILVAGVGEFFWRTHK